jgi:hypothetical protein
VRSEAADDDNSKDDDPLVVDGEISSVTRLRRPRRTYALAVLIILAGWPIPALAAEEQDRRWGVSIWGLSYHFDEAIDFEEANFGVGLRYYASRLVFVEVDALRNSNGGLAVPVTAALDIKVAPLGSACSLYAVAAGTVVYYQNERTGQNYVRAGPVPGVTLGCGRVKTNAMIVFRRARQPVTALVASLTILLW